MPLPFAIPPTVHSLSPSMNFTAYCFGTVSVVMIAFTALSLPSAESPFASSFIWLSIGSIGSTWPITPVDATITSFGSIESSAAASSHIFCAFSTPSALQVLAFLLLAITAFAVCPDASRCAFVT